MRRVGYKRWNPAMAHRELDSNMDDTLLVDQQLDKLFEDRCYLSDLYREGFEKLKQYVKSGDTVVVQCMAQLAFTTSDLFDAISIFNSEGVNVVFLNERITFSERDKARNALLMGLLIKLSDFEYTITKENLQELEFFQQSAH